VVIQSLLTLSYFAAKDLADVVKAAQQANSARGVTVIGNQLVTAANNAAATAAARANLPPEQRDLMERGNTIFNELCFTCHGNDGRGQPMTGADAGKTLGPPLSGSPRVQGHRDYVIRVLLNGLTGPLGDKAFTELMIPMGFNKDEWIAAAASFVRNSFGNTAGFVTAADVARVRTATKDRKTPWTVAEIDATLPKLLEAQPSWKISASHNTAAAQNALTLAGWNTGAPQAPDMWFQIELPQTVTLTEVQFDSGNTGRGGGAGLRGGGGAPGAGARGAAGAPPATAAPPAAAGRGGTPAPAAAAAPTPFANAGYPRGYKVQLSTNGTAWSAPVAVGKGSGTRTTIAFTPTPARFIRITQTDAPESAPAWSIMNLRLYTAGPGK
jgi:mono/diheme cytochrome c family protein